MKVVEFARFGTPHQVCACVDAAEVGAPAEDEVVIEVEAFPINPVDLLTIEGTYATRPELPATPGSESVGRVTEVGAAVAGLAPGDRVINLGRNNWAQRLKVKAATVLKVPAEADVLQLAMLKINPATALCMLRNYVNLEPGDWVIQDAANSGVGTCLIRLAKAAGLRTVNVVRRDGLRAPLEALGADVVAVDGDDLAERVAAATGGVDIRLGIDAVAGETTGHLAACLAEGGTLVSYGMLSGRPCAIDPHLVVFRGITLTGFWLVQVLGGMPRAGIEALYGELVDRVADGSLRVEVEATYPIEEIARALEHAARGGRTGKILVTPNGPVS